MKITLPKTTTIQTLLFPRPAFTATTAKRWAKQHGFSAAKTDTTENNVRIRQVCPDLFQKKSFRTITLDKSKGIQAVIGRPLVENVSGSNPHLDKDNAAKAVWKFIHDDWKFHKDKHELYARLARKKAKGQLSDAARFNYFHSFALKAAAEYGRKQGMTPKMIRTVFDRDKEMRKVATYLSQEFIIYWREGKLDQYIPKKEWNKRQETESGFFKALMNLGKRKKSSSKPKAKKSNPGPKHDVVWYWVGGTERGNWNRADKGTAKSLRRMGYVAFEGSLSEGPPKQPPKAKEINAVLTAGLPAGLARKVQRDLNKKYK